MINYNFGVGLDTIGPELLEEMREWRNDPKIRDWCRQSGLISPRDQERWYLNQNDDKSIQMFSIIEQGKQDVIGICGLTSIDLISRRAEFSLYIAPKFQGFKLGYPALKTLVKYGFNDLGLNSIWGESFDGNHAMTMFLAIGFKQEGTRREFYYKNGRFIDAHLFSILRDEFFE
jgi:RimJ/RimL family protein N-acetyltransferase